LACSGGKFVVHGAGEAYDARDKGRQFWDKQAKEVPGMTTGTSQLNVPPDSPKAEPTSSIIKFFILTYTLTWACWIPVVAWSTPARPSLRALLWLLGVFAPSLVALALTAKNDGVAAVRALVGRIFQWQVSARWYLFAVSYMAAIKLAAALAHRMAAGSWPQFGHERPVVILVAILISTPVQSGEEIGWRGYALPRLAERMGFASATLLLGLIWACWHLPQFFLLGADTYGQSFPIWALEVIALSVAIAWLYTHTNGSLLLAMLMHAAINNTKDIVPSGIANAKNAFSLHTSLVMYLTTALLWITAAYFLVRMANQASQGAAGARAHCRAVQT
jgi:membrane protease YdiL (CAAX protease family)